MAQVGSHVTRVLTAYEELGPTPPSICSATPPAPLTIPAAVQRTVAELGLRYRPTSGADLQAHAGRLALLARDLADAPAELLDQAARDWARTSRFMPTAAELVEVMQRRLDADRAAMVDRQPAALATRYNDRLAGVARRRDLQWAGEGENLRLVVTDALDARAAAA